MRAALAGRNPPRAFGRRRVPSLDGHRGRSAEGCRNDRENEPPYLRSTPHYNGSRAVGRPKGAAMIGPVRHLFASKGGRGQARCGRLRAEGRRLLSGHRVRLPMGAAMIRPVRHLFASKARARAERPPLWGSDDVSAMRNYRYRHRDSPYVARRSGERTSWAGRPWAVGGELPGARWRGRPVCAMRSAVQGAAAAPTRACRFFSSTSILGCGAQGVGGAERRTDQFSVRLF